MERTQTLLAKKFTLVVDEGWLREILKHWEVVESGEVFQLLDEQDVELCDDCQSFLTKDDGEVVMDVYKCPDQQEFCLNCCGCPGDHEGGAFYE
jgi:hypothetical protein